MNITNKTLKKELVEELNHLNDHFFCFERAIPFKNNLTLYPVSIEYYNEFLGSSSCCTLNKNDIPDGISMTHLDFLVHKIEDENVGQVWAAHFSKLLELIFRIKNGVYCKDCGNLLSYPQYIQLLEQQKEHAKCSQCGKNNFQEVVRYTTNPKTKRKELWVNEILINSKDFDRLRQIVMYQNFADYKDDSWVHASIREDQRLKNEILSKQSSNGFATLEKKIVAISAKSSYKIEELYNISIRKFNMLLSTIDDAMSYQSDRIGLMSGMVTSKKPLEHWIYKNNQTLYDTAVDAGAYKEQITKQ